jgi:opacity protein-like surface antigen
MRKLLLIVFLLLFSSIPAFAQQVSEYPRGEFFGGFNYQRLDIDVTHEDAYGWHVAANGNLHRNFGIVGEISGAYGSIAGVDFQNYTFMGGPRVFGRYERATPFAHALFGFNHITNGDSSTDFAWGVGGGVDVNINDTWAWRVAQVDYIQVRVDEAGLGEFTSHNFRISTGIVAKWGTR